MLFAPNTRHIIFIVSEHSTFLPTEHHGWHKQHSILPSFLLFLYSCHLSISDRSSGSTQAFRIFLALILPSAPHFSSFSFTPWADTLRVFFNAVFPRLLSREKKQWLTDPRREGSSCGLLMPWSLWPINQKTSTCPV